MLGTRVLPDPIPFVPKTQASHAPQQLWSGRFPSLGLICGNSGAAPFLSVPLEAA